MAQTIDLTIKKNTQKTEMPVVEKTNVEAKTTFQQEWEKGIPADKAFDDLLTYVRGLWKNKSSTLCS